MGNAFDHVPDRPEHIEAILNGLDRYNPETTTVFQDYVQQQCENQTYDCYANLALLKLYQFNPHLSRDESITNILVKSLTVFPSPDFGLGLSLLQPHTLTNSATNGASNGSGPAEGSLAQAVQKLVKLHAQLINAQYEQFWSSIDGDDLYQDLIADVQGFEELMRVRMAVVISQCMQSVDRNILEGWLNLNGDKFDRFITEICGWKVDGETIEIPLNKENEARNTVVRESVKFEQFGRTVKRAFEQPA